MALHLVLLALVRDKQSDPDFWERLDGLAAIAANAGPGDPPEVHRMAEAIEAEMALWRGLAERDQPGSPG